MKKVIIGIMCILMLTGCSNNTNLDNATIYTTIYPVTYITSYLYGDKSNITSIYPSGVNITEYELTDKQIDNYAKGDMFVYLGLTKENEFARSFIKKNKNIKLINTSYSLNTADNIEEIWLSPKNFLLLLKNTKDSLNEYLNNTYKEDEVNLKYDELYNKVSWIDAELRSLAKLNKESGNNNIIIQNNSLKYLSEYGFNVISIEDIINSNSDNAKADLQNKFKSSKYKNILKLKNEIDSDFVKDLEKKYNANILNINDLSTNEDSSADYISIQYENIGVIRKFFE